MVPGAAAHALGSILEGPSIKKLSPIVTASLDLVLNAINDENNHVKSRVAWTLSRILEFLHSSAIRFFVINPVSLEQIWEVLSRITKYESNVARYIYDALYFLTRGNNNEGPGCDCLLSGAQVRDIIPILEAQLIATAINDIELRSSIEQALAELNVMRTFFGYDMLSVHLSENLRNHLFCHGKGYESFSPRNWGF